VSKNFGVNQTLELLDNLKRTVAEFAVREEKLTKDFQNATNLERQRRDKATEQIDSKLTETIAEADTNFQTQKESLDARQKARRAWIAKAYKASQKHALEGIGDKAGRRKHKLQAATMKAQRDHESGRINAEKVSVEFKTSLAQEKESWNELEAKVRNAFKGFGKFTKLLSRTQELPASDLAKHEYDLIAELDALLIQTRGDLQRFEKMSLPKIFRVFTGKQEITPLATTIAEAIVRARRMHDICLAKSDSRFAHEIERVEKEFKDTNLWVENQWKLTLDEAASAKESTPQQIEEKYSRVFSTNEDQQRRRSEKLWFGLEDDLTRLRLFRKSALTNTVPNRQCQSM
jgi:hypothetical protein